MIILGFWMKRDVFYAFPDVRFQGKYIFVASTNNKTLPIVCSSYPILMNNMKKFPSCSQIRVGIYFSIARRYLVKHSFYFRFEK